MIETPIGALCMARYDRQRRRRTSRPIGGTVTVEERPELDISVIIPARDAEATIVRAISSVLHQTHQPLEIIVVDDGSTDRTGQLAQGTGHGRVRVMSATSESRGVSAARNLGVQQARGGVVAFLDADDVWYPRKLEMQLPLLKQDVALVGCLMHWLKGSGRAIGVNGKYDDWLQATQDLREARAMPLAISTLLLRRADFLATGGFNERLLAAEDLEFCSRMVRDGRLLVWPPDAVLAGYVVSPASSTLRNYRQMFSASESLRREGGLTGGSRLATASRSLNRRRRFWSAWQYRSAAAAYGASDYSQFLLRLISAYALAPHATLKKLRTIRRGHVNGAEVPAEIAVLFDPAA